MEETFAGGGAVEQKEGEAGFAAVLTDRFRGNDAHRLPVTLP